MRYFLLIDVRLNIIRVLKGANRAVLRDMEAINKMIDLVGRPELNDLHVFAIMVISNCLEDTESMEVGPCHDTLFVLFPAADHVHVRSMLKISYSANQGERRPREAHRIHC